MRKEAIATMLVMIMIGTIGYALVNNNGNGDDVSNTGNDVNNEIQEDWSVYYVDSGNDLPVCDSTTLGRLYYVASNSGFEACTSSGWVTVDLTGAVGANGTDGMDGINGTDGMDGIDGIDGQNGTGGVNGTDGVDGQDVNQTYVDEMVARIAALEGDLLNATTCQLGPWANCQGANLTGMNLSGLDLTGIDLRGALLTNANLTNTTLVFADLTHAIMFNVECTDANFGFANMRGSWLNGASGENVDFSQANLQGVGFSNVEITDGSSFHYADLAGANFFGADLMNNSFQYADLIGITFYAANVSGGNFAWADLSNSWTGFGYFYDVYWDNTICPDGTNSHQSTGNSGVCYTW